MGSLKRNSPFFTIFNDKDEVTLEEIYILCKREEKDKEKNRQWISSSLYLWKKRGIVEPIYGSSEQNKWAIYSNLIGIKLTEDGKSLLGRNTKNLHTEREQGRAGETLHQAEKKSIIDPRIMRAFEQLSERLPNRKVTLEYDVKINDKHRATLENPRIVIYPVAQ